VVGHQSHTDHSSHTSQKEADEFVLIILLLADMIKFPSMVMIRYMETGSKNQQFERLEVARC
jgi:hypothetical protein